MVQKFSFGAFLPHSRQHLSPHSIRGVEHCLQKCEASQLRTATNGGQPAPLLCREILHPCKITVAQDSSIHQRRKGFLKKKQLEEKEAGTASSSLKPSNFTMLQAAPSSSNTQRGWALLLAV